MSQKERDCHTCPAFYKCETEGLTANGRGWIEKEIDGKNVPICRPGTIPNRKRTMQKYSFYCLAAVTGKKIGGFADWTGRTPKWCPLGREV